MLYRVFITALLCTVSYLSSATEPSNVLKIAYGADNIPDFEAFLDGKKAENINSYNGHKARRDVIDGVLFVQALRLGGIEQEIEFISFGTYKRMLHAIAKGQVVAGAQTNWGRDTLNKAQFYNTQPLVQEGEFVVGLYTSASNKKALSAQSLADLKTLSAVSSKQWRNDWQRLQKLGVKPLYNVPIWDQMVKMVASERADFTLAPFQANRDFQLFFDNVILVPIPNIKLALPGTRHWTVSQQHPDSIRVFNALEKGLQQLRADGRIKRAYTESGFFTTAVNDWNLITP